ncbi:MAG: thiamine phosphate synthase [Blastocatellia bacterium]|nr:thiamine phosphate synthase [Blastocatellia bacterium]MCS7157590.1 thiamine phosphate synthase [Blastocatellia bacterium]MCX7751855.1 thiamine phosphate synthase [Blastocatellia bacterium]MDW8166961.1 thiamine phosphate synthase [Acidobacteriota bacterium]MDW8257065.1 thiamine phosphate synthase [Acidobacteriota bacterium]
MGLPRVYAITDRRLSGLSHAEQVRRLAAGGIRLIQLREKEASPRDFYREAQEAVAVARELGVMLLINDRVDIALAVGADGVHLGQEDLPPEKARKLLGPDRLIGYSTHSLEQALQADALPVDYIAIGPIFPTRTKEKPDPVVGVEMVRAVRARIRKPLVAIGGISLETAPQVIAAGADVIAVISDLVGAPDLTARARQYVETLSAL